MNNSSKDTLALLTRIIQSSKEYYQLLREEPQQEHFGYFLASLPEDLQAYYLKKGFKASKQSTLFIRFILEYAGIPMDSFVKERLDTVGYRLWQEQDSYQETLLKQIRRSA